jgi:hypothetical protein
MPDADFGPFAALFQGCPWSAPTPDPRKPRTTRDDLRATLNCLELQDWLAVEAVLR